MRNAILILFAMSAAWAQYPMPGENGGGGGGGGGCTAGAGITCVGSTISVDTAVIESRATAQAGTSTYCRSTTGSATMTCALTPTLTAYTTGSCLTLNADFANVTTATLNVDALTAKSVLGPFGSALAAGDIPLNQPIQVCYNGTAFIKQGFSYLVQDPTAATGVTKLLVKSGAGQSVNQIVEIQNNSGSTLFDFRGIANTRMAMYDVGNYAASVSALGWYLPSAGVLAWSSTADGVNPTLDAGFGRNAAGIVEVNNGTLGTLRDLIQRHPLAGGTSPTITSGFGTTPSIAGKDAAGRITVGSGGTAATGTITFGTAWATAPACTAANETSQITLFPTASTTTLILASTTPFNAADKLVYQCVGF